MISYHIEYMFFIGKLLIFTKHRRTITRFLTFQSHVCEYESLWFFTLKIVHIIQMFTYCWPQQLMMRMHVEDFNQNSHSMRMITAERDLILVNLDFALTKKTCEFLVSIAYSMEFSIWREKKPFELFAICTFFFSLCDLPVLSWHGIVVDIFSGCPCINSGCWLMFGGWKNSNIAFDLSISSFEHFVRALYEFRLIHIIVQWFPLNTVDIL